MGDLGRHGFVELFARSLISGLKLCLQFLNVGEGRFVVGESCREGCFRLVGRDFWRRWFLFFTKCEATRTGHTNGDYTHTQELEFAGHIRSFNRSLLDWITETHDNTKPLARASDGLLFVTG